MHKLTESEVDAIMKIFRLGYSDDFMSNTHLQLLNNENIKASQSKKKIWPCLQCEEYKNRNLLNYRKFPTIIKTSESYS